MTTEDKARWAAIVPAAGMGLRMQGDRPKQLLTLADRPVIVHTLASLAACPELETIIVAAPPEAVIEVRDLARTYGVGKIDAVIAGGATRQESVSLAVRAVPNDFDYLLIHDGVRPLVDQATIGRVMAAAREAGAATAGVPVQDTLAEVDRKGRLISQPSRARMWRVQTPQAFWRPLLVEAQARAEADQFEATDEAGLILRIDKEVRMVEGSRLNIKLTTPGDLKVARALTAPSGGDW